MRVIAEEHGFLLPPDHGLFGNCHASTLALLPNGQRLAAFFAGEREGAPDTAIWLCRGTPSGWQAPVRAFAEDGLAHWNPVLHTEGRRVWLFYKVGATVHNWVTRLAVSEDEGETWSLPRPLVPDDTAPRGPVRNKLVVLSSGEWLAGGSVETDQDWDAFADLSSDHGQSWRRSDVPLDHRPPGAPPDAPDAAGAWKGLGENALWESSLDRVFRWDGVIQPSLWESSSGAVHMLLRSTRGRVYRSDSTDAGRSWSPAYETKLPNNNSGLDLVRLPDGALVLACNPVAGNWGRRFPISLLYSPDNGADWTRVRDMETEEGEFSYPAVVASGDALHVTYTWNRTNIVHHRFQII